MPETYTEEELINAFIQGAKWWEYHSTGATMWQSDQGLALKEAVIRLKAGTLGKDYRPQEKDL